MKEYKKIENIFTTTVDKKKKYYNENVYKDHYYKILSQLEWRATEKVDGMNIRVIITKVDDNTNIDIRGRTDKAELKQDLVDNIKELFIRALKKDILNIEDDTVITFYGEGYGAGINKGGEYCQDKRFIVFDIMINDYWLLWDSMSNLCTSLD